MFTTPGDPRLLHGESEDWSLGFSSRTSQLCGFTQTVSFLWALFSSSGKIKGLNHDFVFYLCNLGQIIEYLVPQSPHL